MSNPTATSYEAASRALAVVVDAVPAAGWSDPSPCEGRTARVLARLGRAA
jgi:hypothetical protein